MFFEEHTVALTISPLPSKSFNTGHVDCESTPNISFGMCECGICVHFREQYGTRGEEVLYVVPVDQKEGIVRVPLSDKSVYKESFALYRIFKQIFLPQGYPDSVSHDYINYQIWDTIQAFCSTITGTLTTHAILKGVGVGNDYVSPLSATVTWVLKDGAGHLGKIVFAWAKGSELDIDSKKWRLRADFLNDLAMGIEIFMLPRFPELSTYILCGTTTMKAIVGVTGGATRSALTQHHAIRGNLADVSSKDSAQETSVNLIASIVGLLLLSQIKGQLVLYTLYFIVTCLHLFANLKAVRSICLRSFNESRFLIAMEEFFQTGRVPSIIDVNQRERVTIGQTVSLSLKVKIGLSAKNLTDHFRTSQDIENVLASFDPHEKFIFAESRRFLGIYLHFEARQSDVLKAYFYAVSYLQDRNQFRDRYWEVHNKWNDFLGMAQKEGWLMASHLMFVDEYRLDWKI